MKTIWFGLGAVLLAGCTPTAHERFGDVARYAPDYGGYVVGHGSDVVVLRDPVTRDKLRCREDIERAAPALAAVLDDVARDAHAGEIAPRVLAPFYVAGAGASLVALGLIYPAMAIHEGVVASQPRQVYLRASSAFVAGRFAEAREQFFTVVLTRGRGSAGVDDLAPVFVEHALYYFAVSSEALHRDDEARLALRRFLDSASGHDELRYVDAEARLARLEGGKARCASRDDFRFA